MKGGISLAYNDYAAVLRRNLVNPVDEKLFAFTADNLHTILYSNMDRLSMLSQASEEELHGLFRGFGADSLEEFKDVLRPILYQSPAESIAKRPMQSIMDEMFSKEISNLQDLVRELDLTKLDMLTQEILSAPEVLVVCSPGTQSYAGPLTRNLCKLGIKAQTLVGNMGLADYYGCHDRSPLVIAFGFNLYYKPSVFTLRSLRQRGFRIISVTDREDSPFALLSDYYFIIRRRSFDFLESYTAGMAWINLLLLHIASQDVERNVALLRAHSAAMQELDGLF